MRVGVVGVEVLVDGEWMALARTGLKDDICTFSFDDSKDIEKTRESYIDKIKYGARIIVENNGFLTFAVVDSLSDG